MPKPDECCEWQVSPERLKIIAKCNRDDMRKFVENLIYDRKALICPNCKKEVRVVDDQG